MSVSRDQVLAFINQRAERPLKIRELARALRISDQSYPNFRRLIRQMANDGTLVKLRHNRYGAPSNHHLTTGRISIHPNGYGLLAREDGDPDIFIGASRIGQALHGDRALVRITRRAQGTNRPEGELVRVIERAEQTIVGTFADDGHYARVISDDPRIPIDVRIPRDQAQHIKVGQKVVAKLSEQSAPQIYPEGTIVEVLGEATDPGTETLILIKKHGLPLDFPNHVLEAAKEVPNQIAPREIERRVDLRDITCFTIDPADARDHDDAVSLEVLDDQTYRVGIHIADVSHYVTEGSPFDHEALTRGTSVYLPDRVIPMLPERLSGNICSLRPNEDRLTLSVLAQITRKGDLVDVQIAETVICSRARLAYEEVQRVLDQTPDAHKNPAQPFADDLFRMEALRKCLTEKRMARGAIDFELPEPYITLNEEGRPIDISPRPRLNSHRLIEEFMLLANEIVARYMAEQNVPILYRVHEPPDSDRLAAFGALATTLGYRLTNPKRSDSIQRFLETFKNEPVGRILSNRLLRSMKKAVYTPNNLGHFGLACETYTHFTSPIRRYPDLLLHRALRDAINKKSDPKQAERRANRISDIGDLATKREIAANQAEWDAMQLMQVLYLEDKVGEHFDATIVDVRPIGFFVQLNDVLIEGLVHVKTLNDDYYIHRELQGTLVGERTGTTFQLGDSVQVQLAQIDRLRLRIDFHLITHNQRTPPRSQNGRSKRSHQKHRRRR